MQAFKLAYAEINEIHSIYINCILLLLRLTALKTKHAKKKRNIAMK